MIDRSTDRRSAAAVKISLMRSMKPKLAKRAKKRRISQWNDRRKRKQTDVVCVRKLKAFFALLSALCRNLANFALIHVSSFVFRVPLFPWFFVHFPAGVFLPRRSFFFLCLYLLRFRPSNTYNRTKYFLHVEHFRFSLLTSSRRGKEMNALHCEGDKYKFAISPSFWSSSHVYYDCTYTCYQIILMRN